MEILEILKNLALKPFRRVLTVAERFTRHNSTLRKAKVPASHEKAVRQGSWWEKEAAWFAGGTTPRLHNIVTPLVDGENFFGELHKQLCQAQSYVFIAGWTLTPYFPVQRDNLEKIIDSRLVEVLSEISQRVPVRILLWNGAPLLFEPTTRYTQEIKQLIDQQGKADLVCYLDKSAKPSHCHHQKAIVIDGQVAFVGGMDLTSFMGDRFDSRAHPLRAGINWHDVQLKLEGEVVGDVEHNFRQRWQEAVKKPEERLLPPHREPGFDPNWNTPVQIVRTIPRKIYRFAPRGEFGIFHAYISLIEQAQHFIYLENQYIWSPHILEALSKAIQAPHPGPFRVVLVLPAKAEDGKWDNDNHVARLRELDGGRGIVSVYSLYTSGPNIGKHAFTYRAVYVHAKVAIVDDEWFMVGSANLNNRGLITDSEINALVHKPEQAKALRISLWAEHLGIPPEEVAETDAITVIDQTWKERANANREILKTRNVALTNGVYPYAIGKMPGSWLLEEVEVLTLEH
ncbi:MAG TPA: phospholipase D family protein [Chloroflexia bacterium]|nr:phospholipase D family protein [Chloroflexia bacterium]